MKALHLTEDLYRFVVDHSPEPSPVLAALRDETARLPGAMMQIAPEQGAFMHLLVKLIGARRIVEVGCFTGYSAIAMASALPTDGRLVTLDINPETAAVARRYFEKAGLAARIDLRLGPALDSLESLRRELGEGSIDLMFIDADKTNMRHYYEHGLRLLRPGGLIIADNVLWGGSVVEAADTRPDTVAIRAFDDFVAADERVDRVLLPIADGLFLARKR